MGEKNKGFNPESTVTNYEEIKEEFLRPFSDEEISEAAKRILNFRSLTPRAVIHRHLHDHDYAVNFLYFNRSSFLEFQISATESDYLAKLIFEEKDVEPGRWNLRHRNVSTGELQISGSEFLQQAENCMEALADKQAINLGLFEASTSQLSVVEWLEKNGYEFFSNSTKKTLEDIKNNPSDYELFYISDGEHEYLEEPFLFKKSEVDPDQLTLFMDPRYNDGRHIKISNPQVYSLKGLMRFHLEKLPGTDLAKP